MVDTTITLIRPEARVQDATAVWRTTAEAQRTIFARMDDVTRSEFFGAGQAGFSPEFMFLVNPIEYEGEKALEWNGQRYAIYRSHHVSGTDDLELYAQREVGVQRGT